MLLLDQFAAPDDVHRNVGVEIAEYVQVQLHRRVDFDDVLFAHARAPGVLDNRYRTVQRVEVQIPVNEHTFPGLNVVEYHAVPNTVNIHNVSFSGVSPSRNMMSAIRIYFP